MKTIYKYRLDGDIAIPMPMGSKLLTAQMHQGELVLWAEVDPDYVSEMRHFDVVMTGDRIGDSLRSHIATVQDGPLVKHVYEYFDR